MLLRGDDTPVHTKNALFLLLYTREQTAKIVPRVILTNLL
jgi:hypothetical protein